SNPAAEDAAELGRPPQRFRLPRLAVHRIEEDRQPQAEPLQRPGLNRRPALFFFPSMESSSVVRWKCGRPRTSRAYCSTAWKARSATFWTSSAPKWFPIRHVFLHWMALR
ncbi:MAG TPA: hypothetical protein VMK12_08585, partial [Anaeromyxobacteraceae bacterium]|nr:hypothetical protein [Anaeromyxobacteraceae bacterium]